MSTSQERGFEPATGDGPEIPAGAEARAAEVRTAFEGMLQIRRLTRADLADPEGVPAPWELNRPLRAVALALGGGDSRFRGRHVRCTRGLGLSRV